MSFITFTFNIKIISKKLEKVLVIEDDALVDMKLLKNINLDKLPQDKMIYFGGVQDPLLLKIKNLIQIK